MNKRIDNGKSKTNPNDPGMPYSDYKEMTEDDWSLNELKQKTIAYVDKSIDIPYCVYREEAIETLRQKLIEDLQNEYKCSSMLTLPINLSLESIERIINKRFGVEE